MVVLGDEGRCFQRHKPVVSFETAHLHKGADRAWFFERPDSLGIDLGAIAHVGRENPEADNVVDGPPGFAQNRVHDAKDMPRLRPGIAWRDSLSSAINGADTR